jgi:hypothetical protein
LLKMFLGVILISFFIVTSQSLRTDSFYINVLLNIPHWVCIFIFFQWKNWVEYENKEEKKREIHWLK